MKYWALKDSRAADEGIINLEGRRKPTIANSDRVVLYDVDGTGTVVFVAHGSVARVETKTYKSRYITSIALDVTDFDSKRRLSEFVFSLLRVDRYDRPESHFVRAYVSLDESDYYAIVEARVFWARTAFGYYLNSLPQSAVARFIGNVAILDPQALAGHSSCAALWTHLRSFIGSEYIAAFELLDYVSASAKRIGMRDVFVDLRIDSEDSEVVTLDGVAAPVGGRDLIARQHRALQAFVDGDGSPDSGIRRVINAIDGRIMSESVSEMRFEAQFKGTPWPIITTLF